MGCSTSKLEDEEVVQLCKDRKNFVKQAVQYRLRFASGHVAYIQSMKRVSAALREYVEGDEPREFSLDAYVTPPFAPVKANSGFITISSKSFRKPIQSEPTSTMKINYYRPGGNPAVVVQERPPQSPETVRVEAYPSMHNYGGGDGFFQMQSSPVNSSSFFHYSPYNNRPNLPPPSPPNAQWDYFWNPFSSVDYYSYPNRSSLDQTNIDDDITGLRRVREEEGIPELEEETEHEEIDNRKENVPRERGKLDLNHGRDEVIVEDVNDDDDEDDDDEEKDDDDEEEDDSDCECDEFEDIHGDRNNEINNEPKGRAEPRNEMKGLQSHGSESFKISEPQNSRHLGASNPERVGGDIEPKEETLGFTVYVNRTPTSMAEVVKYLEEQFTVICKTANEVSGMLETTRAHYTSSSSDLTAVKMLNPVALLRSASSQTASSRFLSNSSSYESCESSGDFSEESCMFSGSHQSTLDRLFAWEKKLYQEVRAGERVRIAYEKKCKQLKIQDVKGEDPASVEKTRAAIRDLHTQIKVSIHSVEAISKRIATLMDKELQPQLLELVQGLARMWKVMAESHQSQKRTLDEAKLLLANTPKKLGEAKRYYATSATDPHQLARAAANLESELRNWRACFESWISSQRSYIGSLSGWLLRCLRSESDPSKFPFSPRRSNGAPPIFGICIRWSRFLDSISEVKVIDGMDFFAAGVGSVYAQQLREESRRTPDGSRRYRPTDGPRGMEVVEFGHEDDESMSAERMAEVAIKVLCAGMSVAVSSLTEFAVSSAENYEDLINPHPTTVESASAST